MTHTIGSLKYGYKITIDLSKIVDAIADRIVYQGDDYCWEVDGDDLIITSKHTSSYERWTCKATLESPAEDELDISENIERDVNPKKATISALHGIDKIRAKIIMDDDFGDE